MNRLSITSLIGLVAIAACGTNDDVPDAEVAPVGDLAVPAAGATASIGARAVLRNAQGAEVGTVMMRPVEGGVDFTVNLTDLPSGPHAVHVHETGTCTPPAFTSAGGHFNPESRQHGLESPQGPHAGDLPNVIVDDQGQGSLTIVNPRVSLGGGDNSLLRTGGTAIVVHAGADDYQTDPAGDAGDRLACGVIEAM